VRRAFGLPGQGGGIPLRRRRTAPRHVEPPEVSGGSGARTAAGGSAPAAGSVDPDETLLAALRSMLAGDALEARPEDLARVRRALRELRQPNPLLVPSPAARHADLARPAHARGPLAVLRRTSGRPSRAPRLGWVVAGSIVVALLGATGAGVANDALPGPLRGVAYDLGLPVSSPALVQARAALAALRAAVARADRTEVRRRLDAFDDALRAVPVQERPRLEPEARQVQEAALELLGASQQPSPSQTPRPSGAPGVGGTASTSATEVPEPTSSEGPGSGGSPEGAPPSSTEATEPSSGEENAPRGPGTSGSVTEATEAPTDDTIGSASTSTEPTESSSSSSSTTATQASEGDAPSGDASDGAAGAAAPTDRHRG
jgi:hypothetical protein